MLDSSRPSQLTDLVRAASTAMWALVPFMCVLIGLLFASLYAAWRLLPLGVE